MKTKYLTTEPPLDPPEPVDLKGEVRRRDQKQEMDAEIYTPIHRVWTALKLGNETEEFEAFVERMEEEQRLNLWRQQSEDDEREWAIAQEEKEL